MDADACDRAGRWSTIYCWGGGGPAYNGGLFRLEFEFELEIQKMSKQKKSVHSN